MLQTTVELNNKSFKDILGILSTKFPSWTVNNLGSKGISHFHIYSGDPVVKGVLEVSEDGKYSNKVILKVADNRKTEWSLKAFDELKRELQS